MIVIQKLKKMEMFIIYSLSGDYPGVKYHPAGPFRRVAGRSARMEEENRLLREELNELYLKYDRMAAAFGEMCHLAGEAVAVAGHYSGEDEA